MNKQQLASKIWASAIKMQPKIETSEYKDYILGFIFYKYLSDQEEELLRKNKWLEDEIRYKLVEENRDDKAYIQKELGYFISYKNLFSTWIHSINTLRSSDVTEALDAFERNVHPAQKKVFDKVFNTLQSGLHKLEDNLGTLTKTIIDLLILIKDIPTDNTQGNGVLGFICESLIENFATHAGKKAGSFYTPDGITSLMAEMIANHFKGCENIDIYDPTSGSGSLLIGAGKTFAKRLRKRDCISYYAQDLNESMYNLTRMNLIMHGIAPDSLHVRCGDTLGKDWPWFDDDDPALTYNPHYVDAVVSIPPYSQHWDNKGKGSDPRFKEYGVAPRGKADYAFLLHGLFHVKPHGIMVAVFSSGILSPGSKNEEKIRKTLIEKNNIDAIIGLPANIFMGSDIPTIIMVLRPKCDRDDILFVDASHLSERVGKRNILTASDIRRITDTYIERKSSAPSFSRLVTREEIRRNGYNLNIACYIEPIKKPESGDAPSVINRGIPRAEVDFFSQYWEAFPTLRDSLFYASETPYTAIKAENMETCIHDNQDVKAWEKRYKDILNNLPVDLHTRWIDNMFSVDKDLEESAIVDYLFEKLDPMPLVDKYQVFQILDNHYRCLLTDLEIIQTEGFEATRVIEPFTGAKKNDGKVVTELDRWQGRILPFELVQRKKLSADYEAVQVAMESVASKEKELAEIRHQFDEKDLQADFFDRRKNTFISRGVNARAKAIRKELKDSTPEPESFEESLLSLCDKIEELKVAKRQVKTRAVDLLKKTMSIIPMLSEEEIKQLLHDKWITPLCEQLATVSSTILSGIITSLRSLDKKYAPPIVLIGQEQSDIIEKPSEISNGVMKVSSRLIYIDYLDHMMSFHPPFEDPSTRLRFDLLLFSESVLCLSVPACVKLESTTNLLMKLTPFWKNGKIRLILDKKHGNNPWHYFNHRNVVLEKGFSEEQLEHHFEYEAYHSPHTKFFYDTFMHDVIDFRGNNFVRKVLDTDEMFRKSVITQSTDNQLLSLLPMNQALHMGSVFNDLAVLAEDKNNLFQRSAVESSIIHESQASNFEIAVIRRILDKGFAYANGISSNAAPVSQITNRLTGLTLIPILRAADLELYNLICDLSWNALYRLSTSELWLGFIDQLNRLLLIYRAYKRHNVSLIPSSYLGNGLVIKEIVTKLYETAVDSLQLELLKVGVPIFTLMRTREITETAFEDYLRNKHKYWDVIKEIGSILPSLKAFIHNLPRKYKDETRVLEEEGYIVTLNDDSL